MSSFLSDDDDRKIIKFKCRVTILAGRNLAPKDRVMGIKATSDPYVEVWANGKKIGTTPVKLVTLNPVWDKDNEFTIQMVEAYHLPPPKLLLKIWDEDKFSDPDAMGTITLIVPARNDDTTEWYEVPKNSAKNAKGDLKVRIQTARFREKRSEAGERPTRGSETSAASRRTASSPVPNNRTKSKSSSSKSPTRTKSDNNRETRSSSKSKSPTRRERSKSPSSSTTRTTSSNPPKKSLSEAAASAAPPKRGFGFGRTASPIREKSEPRMILSSYSSTELYGENRASASTPQLPPPPPLQTKPRRTMEDTPNLPPVVVHECDKILNEDSYWDQRIEELGWELEDLQARIAQTKPFTPHLNPRNSIMPIVQHLQEEVVIRTKARDEALEQIQRNKIDLLQLKVTVIQGIGLVAKDQDEYGRWVSSDPYVELWRDRKIIGKTRTEEQTLDPIWNEQFVFQIKRSIPPKIALRIWDEDYDDEPDCLGTVTLKLPHDEMEITEWYEIPRYTNADRDASGFLQIKIESDLIIDKKTKAEQLQKEVNRLEEDYANSGRLLAPPKKGRNSLEPTMEYLKQKNKELIKETVALEQLKEQDEF